ncbi:MAG: NTP transferase domain-containing protein, partial [Tannerella sp.]|nr:NTP transferase domain-containing protein [Tannerella sp.]
MPISWIICAAGEGSRMGAWFGSTPKPLVRLRGVTLLEWSLRSLPVCAGDTVIVVTRIAHRVKEKMLARLRSSYPFASVRWLELQQPTRGQMETALLAAPLVPPGDAIAVYNCDTYFESKTLLALMQDKRAAGIIPCAEAEGDAWSFCRFDSTGRVSAIQEKERISS